MLAIKIIQFCNAPLPPLLHPLEAPHVEKYRATPPAQGEPLLFFLSSPVLIWPQSHSPLDDSRYQSVLQRREGNAWLQPGVVLEDLLGSHQPSVSPGELSPLPCGSRYLFIRNKARQRWRTRLIPALGRQEHL